VDEGEVLSTGYVFNTTQSICGEPTGEPITMKDLKMSPLDQKEDKRPGAFASPRP
jgi:hypothetical protein